MCLWTTDADTLDKDSEVLNIVLKNRPVRNFLSSNSSKLGIAGIKGEGKTFLLKVKSKEARLRDILCIPSDRLVDSLDASVVDNIDTGVVSCLNVHENWVNAWKLSIGLSVISYCDLTVRQSDWLGRQRSHFCADILKEYSKGRRFTPCDVLHRLFLTDKMSFLRALEDTSVILNKLRDLNRAVYLFIDKTDQTFDDLLTSMDAVESIPLKKVKNKDVWYNSQNGLAMAAYEIRTNISSHVKVYYSIRVEALSEMESTLRKSRNAIALVTRLSYTKTDLRDMYEMYIRAEDKSDLCDKNLADTQPSKAFIGTDTVEVKTKVVDGGTALETHSERVFDYIYRHTMKRPQDLMAICARLSNAIGELDNRRIREIVNETSDSILKQYVTEQSTFTTLGKDGLESLERMLPGDLLNSEALISVCDRFNRGEGSSAGCNLDCKECEQGKPLASLANIGLLGEVITLDDGTECQRFKKTGTASIGAIGEFTINRNRFYVLHPSLSSACWMARNKLNHPFHRAPTIVAGDSEPFDSSADRSMYFEAINKELRRERVFVSSTIDDLLHEREIARQLLFERGFDPVMSERPTFGNNKTENANSHDYCIDKALSCGSLISIIGSRYGGEYAGMKYLSYAEELKKKLKPKTDGTPIKPSVSLMELYVALKQGCKCRIYISNDIRSAILLKDYELVEEEVKIAYQFMNHFPGSGGSAVGNWISGFKDYQELKVLLANTVL